MKREVKNKAASIRAKLMNMARAEKIDFDFLKSRLYDVNQEFNEVMERITAFLRPVVFSIKDKTKDNQTWDTVTGQWKE